jgi:signal transduction histidine kinase
LRAELGEVTVQTRLADDLPPVMADRVQLQQVLLNLMMNAIEAMKPVSDRARVLRIETMRHKEHAALVAIQDSGVGLDTAQMQKLFDPFYTTKPQGLGMGLSVCRTILERHGGCLWAEANEGPGATFKFSLPFGNGGRT